MIYPWIWARLPGRFLGKLATAVLLVVVVLAVLWFAVFPMAEAVLGLDEVTVGP
ncbi:hypothetical protein GCM10023194_60130 [Planotetraspora phitsanulokensis]|uniref:Uncharacterized protein n=1 Tax=Planotetraspora phitsanulokensis TaxID=575192 RepID=A0A8J3U3Y8_9ACTN|nr:hypothetical protein [Planotetraspora phitsanulokensis]GII37766.1 hypothetical protein Pph01_27690 [Planotetraspora phitsanulokensis]